jgi:O-antigen/teichoic acid export membrane protein
MTDTRSHTIFLVLVLGNCFLDQITVSGGRVFQTFEMLRYTSILTFLSILARLITVSIMWVVMHHATALQWAIATLLPSLIAASVSIGLVKRQIGAMEFAPKMAVDHLREGLGFSFSSTAASIYNDVDKTMLSHYGLNRENGFYTLAYRVIEIATAPLAAMDYALLPRFFQFSKNGMKDASRLAVKSMSIAIFLGVAIAGFVLLTSPIIPRLVGRDFSGTIIALRWLCWIPLFRGIHRLAGGALTGTGHQNLRNVGQFAVAGINVLLNLWWIPAFGWIGAAWSSVASDGLLALITVLLLWWVAFHHTCTSDVKETAA